MLFDLFKIAKCMNGSALQVLNFACIEICTIWFSSTVLSLSMIIQAIMFKESHVHMRKVMTN